jgi:hypothetical protein
MNLWKQRDHVLGILLLDQGASRPPRTFLQKFYEGECTISAVDAVGFMRLSLYFGRQGRGCCVAGCEWVVLEE